MHEKILLVDDREDNILALETILEPGGYEFVRAYSGNDALKKLLKEVDFVLILMDVRMPGIDGFETASLIYGREKLRNIPIIFITANDSGDENIYNGYRAGAVDFIRKPINPDLLRAKVSVFVELYRKNERLRIQEKRLKAINISLETEINERRSSEQKYRNIFEQSKDAIFLTNEKLDFITVNRATHQLLEHSDEELLHLSLIDLLADRSVASEILEIFKREREISDVEIELLCKSGRKKTCLFSASYISGLDEKKVVQGLLHDITQLREAERYKVMMEKMSVANRLVKTLAHEIRNPLTNIALSTEELKDAADKETMEMYLEIIMRNNFRINEIISHLTRSSQPTEVNLYPVSVETILKEAINAASDRITLKGIQVKIDCPEEPVMVLADKSQFVIALLNIITNSIEAMEKDSGQLLISVDTSPLSCEIRISDNGCGISEENKERLFEPYFTSKKNGLGLGLSSTLNILKSHSAKVDVDSGLGSGTTFSITMPLKDQVMATGSY